MSTAYSTVKATPTPAQFTGAAAGQSAVFVPVFGSALLAILVLL
jgi:hypothetical protein